MIEGRSGFIPAEETDWRKKEIEVALPVYVVEAGSEGKAKQLRDGRAPLEEMEAAEYPSLLQAFESQGVMSVTLTAEGFFRFTEECDQYFSLLLTPQQVLRLADELRRLVETT